MKTSWQAEEKQLKESFIGMPIIFSRFISHPGLVRTNIEPNKTAAGSSTSLFFLKKSVVSCKIYMYILKKSIVRGM